MDTLSCQKVLSDARAWLFPYDPPPGGIRALEVQMSFDLGSELVARDQGPGLDKQGRSAAGIVQRLSDGAAGTAIFAFGGHVTGKSVKAPRAVDVHVGKRIRARRLRLGITQQRLAEALGVTFQQVQKYEKGMNRVGGSRLVDIGRALSTPVEFFFDGADPEQADMPLPLDRHSAELLQAFQRVTRPDLKRAILDLALASAAACEKERA